MGVRYFGAAVPRIEDAELVSGRGRYLDDITLPGMAEAAFVRAVHAHAAIKAIDATAARAVPGVIAVLTAADLGIAGKPTPQFAPSPLLQQNRTQHVLASGAVHFVGEAIAIVVADRRSTAEDAVALVEVDYDPLPVVAELATALDPGAATAHAGAPDNRLATLRAKFGDADQVFARAPHVFREHMVQHRGGCHAMECRGVIATEDPFGQLMVWSATQAPYMVRRMLASFLGRDESTIRVAAPQVGGGFGPKAVIYAEEFAVALAAMKLARPVKWVEDRREHFLATTQQRDQIWDLEVAAGHDGRMLAVRGRCLHDNGAYAPYGLILAASTLGPFPGPYALEAVDITLEAIFTNKVATTPVRGAGRPNAAFVLERLADSIARNLKMDRSAVRRASYVRSAQMPYMTGMKGRDGSPVVYDSGDYQACLDAAQKRFGEDFRTRQESARAHGRYLGMGIASYVEDTGLPPYEGASVRVEPNGKILITTGAAGQGQGHHTIFAQIAADILDVPIERISVVSADTGRFPLGIGTIGSRVGVLGGSSVHLAATRVREKALHVAAEMLEAAEADLVLEDGRVRVAGTDRVLALSDIAARLGGFAAMPMPKGNEPGLAATAYHEGRATTFANGSNVCEVEVDAATGAVALKRYVVAHDCGKLINPMIVDGQIRGGVVHGIGNALHEHMRFDENAQPMTTNYGEYLLPVATDLPAIEVLHLETHSPNNPIGVKGAGEGGTIPATACVISAIEDALAPFGVVINEYPLSPERVLELIGRDRRSS
jgi:aerobic carbon-monoxide dehydrogenase large subunit